MDDLRSGRFSKWAPWIAYLTCFRTLRSLSLSFPPPFSALFSALKSTRDSARKNSTRGARRRSGSGSRRNADCGGERARARVNCGCAGGARDSVLCDRHRRHLHVQHWMGHRRFVSTWWREAEEREGKQRGRQGREKRVRGREKREKAREEGKQRGREGDGRRECKGRTGRESKRSEYTNENVALSFFLACACVCVRACVCACRIVGVVMIFLELPVLACMANPIMYGLAERARGPHKLSPAH